MKYRVTVRARGTAEVTVEADSKDEAMEKVRDMKYDDCDSWEWNRWLEIYHVRRDKGADDSLI